MKKIAAILTIVGVLALPVFALAATYNATAYPGSNPNYYGDAIPYNTTVSFTCTAAVPTTFGYFGGDSSAITALGGNVYTFTTGSSGINANEYLHVAGGGGANCGDLVFSTYTPTCSPATITNGSVAAYPDCTITCNGGYIYHEGICMLPTPTTISFTVPSSTAQTLTTEVGGQLSDTGTIEVMGLAAGVYVFFYVVQQLIALLPGNSKHRRE